MTPSIIWVKTMMVQIKEVRLVLMKSKLMWRIYLEQGGRDVYTGLPLDIEAMDLEHVRGFNNSDDGKPGKEQFEQRENDDNFTLINSNVNQLKSNDSMEKFFKQTC